MKTVIVTTIQYGTPTQLRQLAETLTSRAQRESLIALAKEREAKG